MGIRWRVFSVGIDYVIMRAPIILFRNIEMPVHTAAERRKNAAAKKPAKTKLAASGFKQRKRPTADKKKSKVAAAKPALKRRKKKA